MLKCELDVMEYAITMETEMLESLESLEVENIELLNSDFYRLITSNIDANMYELNIFVYNEEEEEVYRGIAAYYPYDWTDIEILDYSIYNIGNDVYMDIWKKNNR